MEHLATSLPEQRDFQYSYGLAYQLACEKLARIDVAEQCRRSGTTCQVEDSKKVVTLEYFDRTYQITLPDVSISLKDSAAEVQLRDRILLLHYFIQARGTPLSHKLITYKELKEGSTYFPTFAKRAIKPLVEHFGQTPEQLIEVSKVLGGRKADCGDVSVTINAFIRVPVTLVLWRGDDEFPPEGSILFDSTISDYLSTEDITILCQTITWELVKGCRKV